jgi:adenosylcobinamide-GDP ribazoletransferase
MKRIISGWLTAFTLLSRIPVPFRFEPAYSHFGFYLPWMGFIAALPLWGASFLAGRFPATVLAVSGLAVQYWLFNLFHFDGLLDSADGLLYQGPRDKRLAIMKDSNIGSYGLFVGTLYLIAKVALIASVFTVDTGPLRRFIILSFAPVAGRTACAFVPALLKPARTGGLGAMLSPYRLYPAAAGTVVIAAGYYILCRAAGLSGSLPEIALSQIAAIAMTTMGAALLFHRRIGGYTGDTLGATVEIGEMLSLLGILIVLNDLFRL